MEEGNEGEREGGREGGSGGREGEREREGGSEVERAHTHTKKRATCVRESACCRSLSLSPLLRRALSHAIAATHHMVDVPPHGARERAGNDGASEFKVATEPGSESVFRSPGPVVGARGYQAAPSIRPCQCTE